MSTKYISFHRHVASPVPCRHQDYANLVGWYHARNIRYYHPTNLSLCRLVRAVNSQPGRVVATVSGWEYYAPKEEPCHATTSS